MIRQPAGAADERPPELIRFEEASDPYANMVPRADRMMVIPGEGDAPEPRGRNPLLTIVSLVLIAVLVLPVMAEVFARLFH